MKPLRTPVVSLDTRCRFPDRRLFLGRARLSPDAIRITGWTWRGRYDRRIRLAEVTSIAWFAGADWQSGLVFEMQSGEQVALLLRGSMLWKMALERRPLRKRAFTIHRLVEAMPLRAVAPFTGDGRAGSPPRIAAR